MYSYQYQPYNDNVAQSASEAAKNISALKTAKQNQELNKMQMKRHQKEDADKQAYDVADKAHMKELKDGITQEPTTYNDAINNPNTPPKTAQHTAAVSMAQQLKWDEFDSATKKQVAAELKARNDKYGTVVNSIIHIEDPAQQKQAIVDTFAQLSPKEQAEYTQKYGMTPDEWQANIHRTMNDLLVQDGGIDLLQKQADAETKRQNVLAEDKFKHENKLSEIDALYGNKNVLADKTNKTKIEVAEIGAKGREKLAQYKKANGGGKPTVLEMKAAALVDGGDAKDINEAIRMIVKAGRETNVDDPIYGKKTITSKPTFTNALKPPPALVKKKLPPLDVNKYTK